MNNTSKVHATYYAFLNIDNPMVAWEVAIGRIKSIGEYSINNSGISTWQYSLLRHHAQNGNSNKFFNELKLEMIRQLNYSNKVSRLRGIYFFENEEDAHNAIDRWQISSDMKKYISPISVTANNITKLDSEWITFNLNSNNDEKWIHSYWSGEIYGEKPLTELLVDGIGIVMNYELRKEAYNKILQRDPTSTPLLAMACCAFRVHNIEEIAIIRPFLTVENKKIVGRYIINTGLLKKKEKEIIEAINICKMRNELPYYVLPDNNEAFFSLPDLKSLFFEIDNPEINKIFNSIHQ